MSPSSSERDVLRQALTAGSDCPPIEKLELLLEAAPPPDLARHVESCPHCRTELDLLRVFRTAPRDEGETDAVRRIAARLQSPIPEVAHARPDVREPWWKAIFATRWLSPVAIAAACALIAIAVGIQVRHGSAPGLSTPGAAESEVLRSGSFNVIAPLGDTAEVPQTIRWQAVPDAVRYEVRLLEVDRHELWKTTTTLPQAEIPTPLQAAIVPAKTLLLRVTAFDGSGRKLAESEPAKFRLLQKVYKR